MRVLPLLACALFAAAEAGAQEQKTPTAPPAPAAQEPGATGPAPRLKLRLDNPGRYAREVPSEERKPSGTLPGLGGGSTSFGSGSSGSGSSPYPKDTDGTGSPVR